MASLSGETVLITGASSGIGRELASCFAAEGCSLVLTARREEKLREAETQLRAVHGTQVEVIAEDLSDRAAPSRLCIELQRRGLKIDVLVNNAGFGLLGDFVTLPLEGQLEMVSLNVAALTELSRRLLPAMIERGHGGLLNVASTAAYQPGPGMAVYYASKAYVQSFTDALHYELETTSVTVTSLSPGPVATEFGERSGMNRLNVFKQNTMSAQRVAQLGHRAFRQGRRTITPGLTNRIGTVAARWLPRGAVLRVVDRLQNHH